MALVPDVVKKLVGGGWMVRVQSGAGREAAFTDAAYTEAGGATAPDGPSSVAGAGLVVAGQRRRASSRCRAAPRAWPS